MMECSKIQSRFDDLAENRLPETVRSEIQRHLAECTDCRVAQHRGLRLQQLIAVKRHEQPGGNYFESFLDDFHRRLATELAPRPGLVERVCQRLHIQHVPVMRYGFAQAMGVAVAVAMICRGLIATDWIADRGSEDRAFLESPHTVLARAVPSPHSTPRTIASFLPPTSEIPPAGSALIIPVPAHAVSGTPRYVLDHISVTPASYEVASIHF